MLSGRIVWEGAG